MGVAGFAMLGTIVCFVMTFVSIGRYFKWKRKGTPTIGVIGAQKGAPGDRKTHFEYLFDFTINLPSGKIERVYIEKVGKKQSRRIKQGDEIPILWDEKEGCFIEIDKLKNDMVSYPIACAVCLAVLILCFFLSLFLQSL